ncbi:MAG TPA: phosphotransferase [Alphaproteobacteria bacterium]|nr:phosphotransferase [Alphaproteobacteria bacterium]
MERTDLRQKFISAHGWTMAAITALPVDASRRCYFRLAMPDGRTCLLMDAPPHAEEKFREYHLIANALCNAGLSAPEIYASDFDNGFALIEDFGEDTFTRLLNNGHGTRELYLLAVDAIAQMQQRIPSDFGGVGEYTHEILMDEVLRLIDWYYPLWHGARASADLRAEFAGIMDNILRQLPPLKNVLVLRDFHVDNLMLLPGRHGAAQAGLLDFQDGARGNPAYDVLSLLEDARRDLDPIVMAEAWQRYAAQINYDKHDLALSYNILGLQRHGRITGQFIRLWIRDDKPQYLKFMPRVTAQLTAKLQAPVAAPLRTWCEKHLPMINEKWPDRPAIELKKILLN